MCEATNTKGAIRIEFIRSPSNSSCALCASALRLFFLLLWERRRGESARRRLAFRAEVTAPPRHNRAPYGRSAAVTVLSLASIRTMVPLIFSRLALGVKKIGNGRSAQRNRFLQNFAQYAPQGLRLLPAQLRSQSRGMHL